MYVRECTVVAPLALVRVAGTPRSRAQAPAASGCDRRLTPSTTRPVAEARRRRSERRRRARARRRRRTRANEAAPCARLAARARPARGVVPAGAVPAVASRARSPRRWSAANEDLGPGPGGGALRRRRRCWRTTAAAPPRTIAEPGVDGGVGGGGRRRRRRGGGVVPGASGGRLQAQQGLRGVSAGVRDGVRVEGELFQVRRAERGRGGGGGRGRGGLRGPGPGRGAGGGPRRARTAPTEGSQRRRRRPREEVRRRGGVASVAFPRTPRGLEFLLTSGSSAPSTPACS